jgi:bifunctional DNA-binding transcriptional regulator/antitoxin component of YhaV-PrlF toxin-antitoxin module
VASNPDAQVRSHTTGTLLIDEWQVVPEVLGAAKRAVDDDRRGFRSPCNQCSVTMYNMSGVTVAKVSHRGQTSLPAELRHRWGIDEGGEVGFVDLGDAALIVPGGVTAARSELRRVLRERLDEGLLAIDDPDLADQ